MNILDYRIWDTVLQCYVDIHHYVIKNGKICFNNDGELYDQTSKLIVEFFTGETDIYNNKIYYGDVMFDEYGEYTGIVVFEEGGFRVHYEDINDDLSEWTGCQVIGNVHEYN